LRDTYRLPKANSRSPFRGGQCRASARQFVDALIIRKDQPFLDERDTRKAPTSIPNKIPGLTKRVVVQKHGYPIDAVTVVCDIEKTAIGGNSHWRTITRMAP